MLELAELLDRREVCRFFGGTKPLDPATLYRGIRKGRYPAPVKVGPGSSRWLRSECEAALTGVTVKKLLVSIPSITVTLLLFYPLQVLHLLHLLHEG